MTDLTYGPVGDPESTDPFERAQSQMPAGWHVEGQHIDDAFFASRKRGGFQWGRTPEELVQRVAQDGERWATWGAVRVAAARGERDG